MLETYFIFLIIIVVINILIYKKDTPKVKFHVMESQKEKSVGEGRERE